MWLQALYAPRRSADFSSSTSHHMDIRRGASATREAVGYSRGRSTRGVARGRGEQAQCGGRFAADVERSVGAEGKPGVWKVESRACKAKSGLRHIRLHVIRVNIDMYPRRSSIETSQVSSFDFHLPSLTREANMSHLLCGLNGMQTHYCRLRNKHRTLRPSTIMGFAGCEWVKSGP
jgi:hypothetical protein